MSSARGLLAAVACGMLLLACGGGGGDAPAVAPAPPPAPAPAPDPAAVPVAVTFPGRAHDIEWSARHQLLYLSLPSSNGANGNTVVALDPRTSRIVHSHATASEPAEMALSDDEQYLHVVSNGASIVQRFRLPELTLERQFHLGRDDLGMPFLANDIVAVPGQPRSVVVAMGIDFWLPQPHWVRVYDDGTPRPSELGIVTGGSCWSLAWDITGTRLYCAETSLSGFGLQEAVLSADGLRTTRSFSNVFRHFYARMHFSASTGLIYGSDGTVFDPTTARVLTRIDASGAMVPDPVRNRLYYASSFERTVRSFTADSFSPTAQTTGFGHTPTRLVRWGDNGLALATSGNATYLFGGAGTSSFSAAIPRGTASQHIVQAETNRLVWDPVNELLYASVGSRAPQLADSIAVIEPFGGRLTRSRVVGPEPNALAVSGDGQYLYAGIDGEGSIRRLRLPGLEPELSLALGSDHRSRPYSAGAMRVAPSNPRTVAVVRLAPTTLPHEIGGVVIYDDALARPSISMDHPRVGYPLYHFDVAWNEDASKLYSMSLFSAMYALDVSSLGVSFASDLGSDNASRGAIHFNRASRRLFLDSGSAVDPATGLAVGKYRPFGNIGPLKVAVDPAGTQVFVLNANDEIPRALEITVYDASRFVPVKTYRITGSESATTWEDFVQLRPGWFAYRTSQGVHIVQLAP